MGFAAAAAVAMAGVNLIAGASAAKKARRAANQEALLLEEQVAQEAERIKEVADETMEEQKFAAISSGLVLSGSPLLLLEETRSRSEKEIKNLKRIGKRQAEVTRAGGRSQFISNILGTVGTSFNLIQPHLPK